MNEEWEKREEKEGEQKKGIKKVGPRVKRGGE